MYIFQLANGIRSLYIYFHWSRLYSIFRTMKHHIYSAMLLWSQDFNPTWKYRYVYYWWGRLRISFTCYWSQYFYLIGWVPICLLISRAELVSYYCQHYMIDFSNSKYSIVLSFRTLSYLLNRFSYLEFIQKLFPLSY